MNVIIIGLVVFTTLPSKLIVKDVSNPGIKVKEAAVDELDISLPTVPINDEVVMDEPGFTTPPIIMATSETYETLAKAFSTTRVKLITLQLTPATSIELTITLIHVADDIREFVY